MGFETKKAQQREHEHQRELAETQHGYDVDMFNRESQFNADQAQQQRDWERNFYDYQFNKESEYNSPLAQVQRYKAAGLSPGLLASSISGGEVSPSGSSSGSGSASASNTVDMVGAYNSTTNRTLGMLDSISNVINQSRGLSSQIELNKSQVTKNLADAAKTSGVDTDKVNKEIENLSASTSNIVQDSELKKNQVENVKADTRRLVSETDRLIPQQLKESEKRIAKLAQEILNSQNLTNAQVANFQQEVSESISRMHLNWSQKSLLEKQVESFDERFANDMSLSREQFFQLNSNNQLLELKNSLARDILNGDFDNFRGFKGSTREKIFKLRALMTLDPNPVHQYAPRGFGVDFAPYQKFDF